MSFLAKAKKPPETNTIDGLSAIISDFERDLTAAKAELSELNQNSGASVLGGASIDQVTSLKLARKEKIATLEAALREADARYSALETDHLGAIVKQEWEALREKQEALHTNQCKGAKLYEDMVAQLHKFKDINGKLMSRGRADLTVLDPTQMLKRAYLEDPELGAAPLRPDDTQTIAQEFPFPMFARLSCAPYFGPRENMSPFASVALKSLDRIRTLKL